MSIRVIGLLCAVPLVLFGCARPDAAAEPPVGESAEPAALQAAVQDSTSMPDVVKVAIASKEHTTLVAALKAASLVDPLANPGPFTVFAPVNAAFDKHPTGTVDDLLKPENKQKLTDILQHHVTTSARDLDSFSDGEKVAMVSAGPETIRRKDGATYIGGARVIASVRASNGWVHVIDQVLVPATK
ncbi:MAG: fasciclin domain-containing protein [Gemmatimonadaceae bacterium]|jgi:uncharacterized surface protein with fasciclin (FAS1) repeats|nr:fasciclin domain-containing protein [Gemmatimonadaceae bacterium]